MPRITHGHTWCGGSSRTYRIWAGMRRRCSKDLPSYGGKGIKVCDRWRDFANFLEDVGEIPPGLSLDRIDTDRGYEPGNVRLATPREQALNRKCTPLLTLGGVTKPLAVWAKEHNLTQNALSNRLKKGWPEDRLLIPMRQSNFKPGPLPHGNRRHGHARHGLMTRTYRIWSGMRWRCRSDPGYAGRGIKVCGRWQTYENFLADLGEIPDGLTLDRIDFDGDYEPGNVRFATPKEQARNRRSNRHLMICGVTKTLVKWSEESGLSLGALQRRLRERWPEEMLLIPANSKILKERAGKITLVVGGRTQSLAAWSRETGLNFHTIWARVKRGLPPERCIAPLRSWKIIKHFSSGPKLTVGDRTQSLAEWSKETGVNYYTIFGRVKRGLPPEKCIAPKGSWEVIQHHSNALNLTVGGRTQTISEWSRETGLQKDTIYTRMKKGYSPEECIAPAQSAPILTVCGRTQSLAAWSRETGVNLATIHSRVNKGCPPEQCIAPVPK